MQQLDMYTEILIRHQQAVTEAKLDHRRLIREAQSDRRSRFLRPAMVSVGRHMVAWGTQLQRRYDDLHTPSEVALANK